MDCSNGNAWGEDIICGKNGSCVFNGDGLGICSCADGFTHDLIYTRFRDCSVPISTYPFTVFNIFASTFSIILSVVALYYSCNSKGLSRMSLRVQALTMAAVFVRHITNYAAGNRTQPTTFFFMFVTFAFAMVQANLTLYAQVMPMYQASGISSTPFIRRSTATYILFRIFGIIIIGCSIPYGDFNDIKNDRIWNVICMSNSLIIGIEASIINIQMIFESKSLIEQIKKLQTLNSENQDPGRAKVIAIYLDKLIKLNRSLTTMTPVALPGMLLVPICVYATGYFAYSWVVYIAENALLLIGTADYIRFQKGIKPNSDSTNTTSKTSITNGSMITVSSPQATVSSERGTD